MPGRIVTTCDLHYSRAAFRDRVLRLEGGNAVILKNFRWFLGIALLASAGTAPAFTLITPPEEATAPGTEVTSTTTLSTAAQPIVGSIRTQILSRRLRKNEKLTWAERAVAVNERGQGRSDVNYLAASLADPSGGSGVGGGSSSLWISAAYNSMENEFSRTQFYGSTQNILSGFDYTGANRYIVGVAIGFEANDFVTQFNAGDERTRGFNISPYFSLLLSDTWSLDLALGYGGFDTRQSRTVGSLTIPFGTDAVTSDVESTRSFAALNLTNVSTVGNWKLTSSLGALGTRRKQEAYVESNGNAVAESRQSVNQWNLLGEAAYGRGASEAYAGVVYEYVPDPPAVQFSTGEQPPVDKDSYVLGAGWRYFARSLTANFAFTGRVGQTDYKEYGFYMMLRVDL